MVRYILAVVTLVFSVGVHAGQDSIDTSKLSPEQIAKLKTQVSEMSKDPINISASVRKEAEAWGELGANMGKAMVGAAREVGVAADKFAGTSLGKIVVFIVAYKIVGKDILKIAVGSFILFVGYCVAIWFLLTRRYHSVKYEYYPILWGMTNRKKIVECNITHANATTKIIGAVVTTIASTFVGLMVIFS